MHKPRGYSVNDFVSWDQREELTLRPRFQRRDVWSQNAKSHLIDTILRGLPVPIIFIRQTIDPERRKTVREVVDGQQRLRCVISYYKDEFPVLKSQNTQYGGMTFSELPPEAQVSFLAYEFSVDLLEGVTEKDVLQIFARLNTYAQKLNAQELLNAKYFGQFKQAVYDLGWEHLEFWTNNGILRDNQIIRMAEADLTSEIVVAMLTGIQNKRGKIEELYSKHEDSFPSSDSVRSEFKRVIDTIARCLEPVLKFTVFSRRAVFYSLFCAFYHAMYGLPNSPDLGKGATLHGFSQGDLDRIRDSLTELNNKYEEQPTPTDIQAFYEACRRASSDKDHRLTRVKKILEYIERASR